jgi:hypothetical protein
MHCSRADAEAAATSGVAASQDLDQVWSGLFYIPIRPCCHLLSAVISLAADACACSRWKLCSTQQQCSAGRIMMHKLTKLSAMTRKMISDNAS